jgi:hypothetical protein
MELRRMLGGIVVLVACGLSAAPAEAQVATMKRAAETIVMAPVDVFLTPVVVKNTVQAGLENSDMPTALAVPTAGMGVILSSILQLVVTGARLTAGLIELPVGTLIAPVDALTDKDLSTPVLFSTEGTDAILRRETDGFDFVAGLYYLRGS